MGMVRIWQKKKIELGPLTFRQRDMVKLGTVGVATVKQRLAAAQGPADGPARPLTRKYAIRKSRLHLGNRRNLSFTGQMLRGLAVRTVSDNRAKAEVAGGRTNRQTVTRNLKKGAVQGRVNNRDVARFNAKNEPWLVFSPLNRKAVVESARQILSEQIPGMVKAT